MPPCTWFIQVVECTSLLNVPVWSFHTFPSSQNPSPPSSLTQICCRVTGDWPCSGSRHPHPHLPVSWLLLLHLLCKFLLTLQTPGGVPRTGPQVTPSSPVAPATLSSFPSSDPGVTFRPEFTHSPHLSRSSSVPDHLEPQSGLCPAPSSSSASHQLFSPQPPERAGEHPSQVNPQPFRLPPPSGSEPSPPQGPRGPTPGCCPRAFAYAVTCAGDTLPCLLLEASQPTTPSALGGRVMS